MSDLDLAVRADFGTFLTTHFRVITSLSVPQDKPSDLSLSTDLDLTKACLSDDIRTLGLDPGAIRNTAEARHPTAITYILLGARMGSSVLRKSWSKSSIASVRSAKRFLSLATEKDRWHVFCATISTQPALGRTADQIVADVEAIFAAYLTALESSRDLGRRLAHERS